MKTRNKLMFTLALTLLCSACAMNDDNKGGKGNGGSKKGPPAEAFTACKSLSVGASCSVSTPRGTITGSCKAAPSGQEGELACAPEGGDRPTRGR